MEEKELRHNFANNLIKLRNAKGWSQSDLGDAINYSFKNISKWENEETLPSVIVMKDIADCFGVTIDELISDKNILKVAHRKQNHLLISVISSLLPYVIALILFFILNVLSISQSYYAFLGGAVASAITLIVFASLWYKKWVLCGSLVYLVWSLSLLIIFLLNFSYFWILLIIASVLTILLGLLFKIYFTRSPSKN